MHSVANSLNSNAVSGISGELSDGVDCNQLLLPKVIDSPRIELTEWGGRLVDRPYFPAYLANGRDGMLINLLGSGEAHWSSNMRSCYPLPRQLNTSWYRSDRRVFEGCDLQYGHLLPFVDFSAAPVLRGDVLVPRDVRQYFDPLTATVTTLFEQVDNRTMQLLKLRIHTFLTREGLLIQTIDFIEVPDCGVCYMFTMGEPGADYLNAQVPFVKPMNPEFREDVDKNLLRYAGSWEQGRAVGFSLVGGVAIHKVIRREEKHPAFREASQCTDLCYKGDRIWRAIAIQDDYEGCDPALSCNRLLQEAQGLGPDKLWERHCEKWKSYFSSSTVVLPDQSAQFLYNVSRYLIKANLHPDGFLPMGILPYQWQGVAFWDGWFAQQAFLSCGNVGEGGAILDHFLKMQEQGRVLAQEHDSPGARIEWTTGLNEMNRYAEPNLQIHNNAAWAYAIFDHENYTGIDISQEKLKFAKSLLLFVIDRVLSGRHGQNAFTGVDESENDPKPNDSWTLAITLKALESYGRYCKRKGLLQKIDELDRHVAQLQELLEANTDADGILQSFSGGSLPHWGSLIFDLYPSARQALPTIAAMSLNYNEEKDLFNFHGVNRYAERSFPWANNWVARCLARMSRSEALHYWLNNTRSTNMFGGIPERVYYHGELYINWFMSGHASLVWAMNGMLTNYEDGILYALGGIDLGVWKDISFENLAAGGGFKVSLKVVNRKAVSLEVESEQKQEVSIRILSDGLGIDDVVSIRSGKNKII